MTAIEHAIIWAFGIWYVGGIVLARFAKPEDEPPEYDYDDWY